MLERRVLRSTLAQDQRWCRQHHDRGIIRVLPPSLFINTTDFLRYFFFYCFVLIQPALTCLTTDRATCALQLFGQFHAGKKCDTFQCVPDKVELRLVGVVDGWDRSLSVAYNRDASEHRTVIGGVSLQVSAKRGNLCLFVPPINDNYPLPQFCVVDLAANPIANVRIRITYGQCDPYTATTDSNGCAPITMPSTSCQSPVTDLLLVEGTVLRQNAVARSICRPGLLRCTARAVSLFDIFLGHYLTCCTIYRAVANASTSATKSASTIRPRARARDRRVRRAADLA